MHRTCSRGVFVKSEFGCSTYSPIVSTNIFPKQMYKILYISLYIKFMFKCVCSMFSRKYVGDNGFHIVFLFVVRIVVRVLSLFTLCLSLFVLFIIVFRLGFISGSLCMWVGIAVLVADVF